MKSYVVGIAFTADASQLVLVRKKRPAWQAGKLNGLGGMVEAGESAAQAMQRECFEECGVNTEVSSWKPIAVLQDDVVRVDVLSCFDDRFLQAFSKTDEEVLRLNLNDPMIRTDCIASLMPLIERALNRESAEITHLPTNRPKGPAAAGAAAPSWP